MATQAQVDAFNSALASGDVAGATSIAESAGYTAAQVGEYMANNPGAVGGQDYSNITPVLGTNPVLYGQALQDYLSTPQSAYLPGSNAAARGASQIVTDPLTGQSVQLIPGAPGYDPTNALAASYLAEISTGTGGGEAGVADYLQSIGMYDIGMAGWQERAQRLGLDPNIPSSLTTQQANQSTFGSQNQPYVDQQAIDMLSQFDNLVLAGDFNAAALLLDQATSVYDRDATLNNIANYLNTDPKFADLRQQVQGTLYTPENLSAFIQTAKSTPPPTTPGGGTGVNPFDPRTVTPEGVYVPVYQERQGPFGGYYAEQGISPYGGVYGVETEAFRQQSDPFSGAQARAQEMIRNRISPTAVPLNVGQQPPFGGTMNYVEAPPNPFMYRESLSPLPLTALEAAPAAEAAASEGSSTMRKGGVVDQGIAAVPFRR